ncbi:unnamed protein product [Sphagnum balticum]
MSLQTNVVQVAVKKFTRHLGLAVREVQQLAALTHPHIIDVLGFGSHDNVPCMVLAFADGGALYDLLHRE